MGTAFIRASLAVFLSTLTMENSQVSGQACYRLRLLQKPAA